MRRARLTILILSLSLALGWLFPLPPFRETPDPAPPAHPAWTFRLPVTVTAYSPGDGSGWITATGTRVRLEVLAVSRDLLLLLPYQTRVSLLGRSFTVEDTMHPRWSRRVDIWMPTISAARRFGIQRGVIVWSRTGGR